MTFDSAKEVTAIVEMNYEKKTNKCSAVLYDRGDRKLNDNGIIVGGGVVL